MAATLPTAAPAPTTEGSRITNLDLVRGIAVLGILVMNAVSYALGTTAYFNIDSAGTESGLDWVIGAFGEIFVDQKFMAMFSMLFGAGIVLFADRAEDKGRSPGAFSLWRNLLLLGIGLAHAALWDGDVLVVYALSSPLLIAARKLSPRVLFGLGVLAVLASPAAALAAQPTVDATGSGLGEYWLGAGPISDAVGGFLLTDFFARAIGMMLIGVALYRTGFVSGSWSAATYRRLAVAGLGIGLVAAASGLALVAAADFGPSVALVGTIPNTLGTIPAAIGFVSLISLWTLRGGGDRLKERLQAVGRMALTNYLSQTVIGIVVFRVLWDAVLDTSPTRTIVAIFIGIVWGLQLWWSPRWLARFRYGPAEWLWRCATYRRWQPLRR